MWQFHHFGHFGHHFFSGDGVLLFVLVLAIVLAVRDRGSDRKL